MSPALRVRVRRLRRGLWAVDVVPAPGVYPYVPFRVAEWESHAQALQAALEWLADHRPAPVPERASASHGPTWRPWRRRRAPRRR